jgi:hypothetical protein
MSRERVARPEREALPEDPSDDVAFIGLHWLTAGLFLAAGTEAGLTARPGGRQPAERVVGWGPLIAAPLAGATHAFRALRPGSGYRTAAQVMNGVAVAVGTAGVAHAVHGALRSERPGKHGFASPGRARDRLTSLAPLTFAVAGLLGLLLDRDERAEARERNALRVAMGRLERRARIVERLVPQRKRRFDRIVVHL